MRGAITTTSGRLDNNPIALANDGGGAFGREQFCAAIWMRDTAQKLGSGKTLKMALRCKLPPFACDREGGFIKAHAVGATSSQPSSVATGATAVRDQGPFLNHQRHALLNELHRQGPGISDIHTNAVHTIFAGARTHTPAMGLHHADKRAPSTPHPIRIWILATEDTRTCGAIALPNDPVWHRLRQGFEQ